MATILTRVRRTGRRADRQAPPEAASPAPAPERAEAPPLDIAPNDPLLAYLQSSPGPVDVEKLQLDSPALEHMRSMGLRLVVPLVAQGELIGMLNLGPRLSEQEYSTDDRKLLENLAAQAAAALVMAATRSILRAAAPRLISPNEVLQRVNDLLCPDMPPNMFVTCLYGVLDPRTGHFRYANAGHNLPYTRTEDGVVEFRATGLPLGLMPGMSYDEKEAVLGPGQTMLLSSDGLVEAHSPDGEMFGFPRLRELMAEHPGGASLLDHLLAELRRFVGPAWDQEDDVTLVTLWRASAPPMTIEERGTVPDVEGEPATA